CLEIMKKLLAEFFGTYWLVFGGCGSALFACNFPGAGIGFVGVSLAFGLTVLTMAYAVGHISGGHFNPAVSFGLWAGGRFSAKELLPYIIAQCVGAVAAAGTLYTIASGKADGYSMQSAFIAEFALTLFFVLIILGTTDKFANGKFAGIAIGLALTLIHLISIPITNTSVNPARSLSQALFVGGEPLSQLWMFWIAPILGAIVAGFIYKNLLQDHSERKRKNGSDGNGWHADNEKELGTNPIIASLSLGAERAFQLKYNSDVTQKKSLILEHGSLLLMQGTTQHFWKHQIPKTTKPIGPRINLTFRMIE
uniref:Fe2OG dioxygenase domain-containing protein n=1 Tax=Hucho hucho TaxID=62062 RepID=A0A4W5LK30_9TELE